MIEAVSTRCPTIGQPGPIRRQIIIPRQSGATLIVFPNQPILYDLAQQPKSTLFECLDTGPVHSSSTPSAPDNLPGQDRFSTNASIARPGANGSTSRGVTTDGKAWCLAGFRGLDHRGRRARLLGLFGARASAEAALLAIRLLHPGERPPEGPARTVDPAAIAGSRPGGVSDGNPDGGGSGGHVQPLPSETLTRSI
jgi:hypothetical protein